MRQSMRDKRNYIIIGLIILVLFMTVGFAAFSTNLQINGTANIASSWCVGFDNTKTTTYDVTKGKASGTTPTGKMTYSGTVCITNYVPSVTLDSVFYQPGDKIVYTLTIANKSSLTAAIKSITVNGTETTSNQTIVKGNIIYKVEMPESTTLATDASTTMKVTAQFQNTSDIEEMLSGESQTITIGINVEQNNENNAIIIQNLPSEFQEVEYIKSSGAQKINTGISSSNNINSEIVVQYTNASSTTQMILSCGTYAGEWVGQNSGNYAVGPSSNFITNISSTSLKTLNVNFNSSGIQLEVDNNSIFRSATRKTNSYYYLFSSSASSYYSNAIVYSVKIFDENNILLRHMVPCYRKADNVAGMYDTVTNTFFTNNGSGAFTVGPNV